MSRWARRSPAKSAAKQKKRQRGVTFDTVADCHEVDLMSPAKRRMTVHRNPAELIGDDLSMELDRVFRDAAAEEDGARGSNSDSDSDESGAAADPFATASPPPRPSTLPSIRDRTPLGHTPRGARARRQVRASKGGPTACGRPARG